MQEARAMTLIEHLTLVEETRSEINRKHNLVDVMREFNFEVRHSPMPPDGTLRIP